MSFSIYNAKASTTAFYAMLAQSSKFIFAGSGRALFGQPAATAQGGPENTPQRDIFAKPCPGFAEGGKRA